MESMTQCFLALAPEARLEEKCGRENLALMGPESWEQKKKNRADGFPPLHQTKEELAAVVPAAVVVVAEFHLQTCSQALRKRTRDLARPSQPTVVVEQE